MLHGQGYPQKNGYAPPPPMGGGAMAPRRAMPIPRAVGMGGGAMMGGPPPGLDGGGQAMGGMDPRVMAAIMAILSGGQAPGGMGGRTAMPMPGGWQPPSGIPRFQYGGVVNRPTLGILGEAGPEAVVPLGGGSPFGQQQAAPMSGGGGGLPRGGMGAWQGLMDEMAAQRGSPEGGVSYNWGALNNAIVQANRAGMFGTEPPAAMMNALREQGIADAGAQARSARLGLAGRSDVDPSTYGFQSLMSDLQGQGQVAQNMSRANLAARMQQMQFLQRLLSQAIGGQQGLQMAELSQPGFDWGGLMGGAGQTAAGIAAI